MGKRGEDVACSFLERMGHRILERNYNFQFRFTDDKIKGYTFEGVIKNSQFTNALDVICLSAPVSYRMEGDYVVFSKKRQ